MVGTKVGTNTAYAVVPRNMTLQTLNFYCDNELAALKFYYPKTAYIISNSFVAGLAASTNIPCNAPLNAMAKGSKVIIYSSTNNTYQLATVDANPALSVFISNITYATYATNINPIHALVDRIYSTTEYTVANIETNLGGQSVPIIWTGLNMRGPDSMPMAFEIQYGVANTASNIYVNAWGTR